jgi:uncharacterized membrane protein
MTKNNPFGIQDDGRTASLLSYFFVLGWSVSFFSFHLNERTAKSSFHLRQTLMLYISYIAIRYGLLTVLGGLWQPGAIIPISYLIIFVNFSFIALWVMGLISASNNEDRPIPLFGKPAQVIFARI